MITLDRNLELRKRKPRGVQTVLCVDDEPLVIRALHRLLRPETYDVLLASTPEQALGFVREGDVSLVITDERMPGMSGVELLREIRGISPLTKGLILTAYPESVLADDPPDALGIPLVTKPWDDDTLRVTIREVLEAGAPGSAVLGHPASPAAADGEGRPRAVDSPLADERSGEVAGTILVPLDGTPEAELALGAVMPLVRTGTTRIELLRVIRKMGHHRDVHAYLEKSWKGLAAAGIAASSDIRWGDPAEQILRHAVHSKADLISFVTRGRGELARVFAPGVTEKLLRRADIPILASRKGMAVGRWNRILVALDGSRESEAVLPNAVRLALRMGASLHLVRATLPPFAPFAQSAYYASLENPRPYLQDIADVIERQDVPVETAALYGPPAVEIVRQAERIHADLICMMTRGRRGLERFFMGSVTGEVIRTAPCPVFAQRVLRK